MLLFRTKVARSFRSLMKDASMAIFYTSPRFYDNQKFPYWFNSKFPSVHSNWDWYSFRLPVK